MRPLPRNVLFLVCSYSVGSVLRQHSPEEEVRIHRRRPAQSGSGGAVPLRERSSPTLIPPRPPFWAFWRGFFFLSCSIPFPVPLPPPSSTPNPPIPTLERKRTARGVESSVATSVPPTLFFYLLLCLADRYTCETLKRPNRPVWSLPSRIALSSSQSN